MEIIWTLCMFRSPLPLSCLFKSSCFPSNFLQTGFKQRPIRVASCLTLATGLCHHVCLSVGATVTFFVHVYACLSVCPSVCVCALEGEYGSTWLWYLSHHQVKPISVLLLCHNSCHKTWQLQATYALMHNIPSGYYSILYDKLRPSHGFC